MIRLEVTTTESFLNRKRCRVLDCDVEDLLVRRQDSGDVARNLLQGLESKRWLHVSDRDGLCHQLPFSLLTPTHSWISSSKRLAPPSCLTTRRRTRRLTVQLTLANTSSRVGP